MSIIELDKNIAAKSLHTLPFGIQHNLANHPQFALPELVKLAKSLPRDKIEFNAGDLDIGQTAETTPQLSMAPEEVINQIEQHNAWMVIKRVDEVPQYRAILEEFVVALFASAGKPDQKYSNLEGYIFVSSANATTPFHMDAEENVLVQIKGNKVVHIFDNEDRSLISEEAMEISPSKFRNQTYEDSYQKRATEFILNPGDGVHIPYMDPHWVRVGGEYSVSMAMTWKTPEVERMNKIRLMNGSLRHYGWPQSAPGVSPFMDTAKVGTHDAVRMVLDPLRKSEKIRGLLRRAIYGKNANYYYNETTK